MFTGTDKQLLVPLSADMNANETHARIPQVKEPTSPCENGGKHPALRSAQSLPLESNGDLSGRKNLSVRERSKSEVLGLLPRPASGDVSYLRKPPTLERQRSGSVQSLVEHVLHDEGLKIAPSDDLVRVAEREIVEAFDISADELNEAASRLLTTLGENLGGNEKCRNNEVAEDMSKVDEHGGRQVPESPSGSLWRESLKSVPESCIVITDL